ncbi:hypothetical protein SDRG_14709 [Saprolegnia diclina VS20]|uniref:At2g23090-like zinc-binding domain-containing protein n=1 Tax=Saprolegnia diclina (strain VS20) TaxID=1156394 RepID=T0R622_SAPDV|nr:hypothetical protein SDRG_14709 [Saprolegnia diclina VS20]EQC27508.1 hypothetical protein SDRG_14709 [Saprolegnia diclina VS20]|eukprot:XP_008619082.1 hypothetical protein SDRG_14709 [Saprolegnia diclina VS20]
MSMNKLQMQLKKKEKERKAAGKKGSIVSSETKAKSAADAEAYICSVCRQSFSVTSRPPVLVTHAESRHPKLSPEQCFSSLANVEKA